jgi:hypothetical protein
MRTTHIGTPTKTTAATTTASGINVGAMNIAASSQSNNNTAGGLMSLPVHGRQ